MRGALGDKRATPLRVALDHNFPIPIVRALGEGIAEATLAPIAEIDARMGDLDDHEVVRAVAHRGYDMLVSCDRDYFEEAAVLTAVLQCRLSVVVVQGQGHDPVAASGLLLAYVKHLAAQFDKEHAQIFKLRVGRPRASDPWDAMKTLAEREKISADALYKKHRVADGDRSL